MATNGVVLYEGEVVEETLPVLREVEENWPVRVELYKVALAEAQEPIRVKEIIDIADEARRRAKRAKLGREAMNCAAEVRLWAERRAGEMRMLLPASHGGTTEPTFPWSEAKRLLEEGQTGAAVARSLGVTPTAVYNARNKNFVYAGKPRSARKDFDREMGIESSTVAKWTSLAEVSEEDFVSGLSILKADGKDITYSAWFKATTGGGKTRVESGIWTLLNGRFQIKWKERRVNRRFTLPAGSSLDDARRELGIRRGTIKDAKADRGDVGMSHLYETLDLAMKRIAAIWPGLTFGQKQVLEEANVTYSHLDDMARAVSAATNVR